MGEIPVNVGVFLGTITVMTVVLIIIGFSQRTPVTQAFGKKVNSLKKVEDRQTANGCLMTVKIHSVP